MLVRRILGRFRNNLSNGLLAICGLTSLVGTARADELLVADRLTNRILRYSETGTFVDVLVDDPVNLSEPNGMALSPDGTQLFVASRQNSTIVRYDYNGVSATNPTVVISAGVSVPASLLFSGDGQTLYVSNLGAAFDGSTVGQFHPDGSVAGPDLTGGIPTGRSGLALAPGGELLVSSFQDGSVLRYDSAASMFVDLIPSTPALQGLGNILVRGNELYAAAGFAGSIMKFDATTGMIDANFAQITGLEFPASLSLAPDGNGILVGILGFVAGSQTISRYGFDGAFLGTFAPNSVGDPSMGYVEPTGLLVSSVLVPLCGDLDLDRDVDSADLVGFLGNWTGADPGPEIPRRAFDEGDCDDDGDIDSADLLEFLAAWTGALEAPLAAPRFGPQGAAREQVAAVPEPVSGLVPLAIACVVGASRRRLSAAGRSSAAGRLRSRPVVR